MLIRTISVHRRIAPAAAMVMLTNLMVAGTIADPAEAFHPFADLRRDEPVEMTPLEPSGDGFVDPSADQVWQASAEAVELPAPGSAVFELGAGAPAAVSDDFPIVVSRHPSWAGVPHIGTSGRATVTLHDQDAARAAGVAGLLVRVDATGVGTADLAIEYGRFAELFGGGWASRLRIVELPACALTTPGVDGCLRMSPLDSRNDAAVGIVSTSIELSRDADSSRLFAVTAAASSEGAGDYRATDLSLAGSWSAGGNDGAFTYDYPLRLPPSTGPVPSTALNYSSASHDGRTSGSNNQASWVGDGWSYEPGFVERSYPACTIDDEGSHNNPDLTGDLCWDGDGASMTMSLNGTNSTLVRDDATGAWRAEADTNWRIELVGSAATPAAGTSERWKVTTPDGIQYWFASEASASSSRWTVPVFGNHSGEPCHASSFAGSSCRQAYRWMLDKIIDTHGNMVRYFYTVETGHYGAAGDANNRVSYHRAGQLQRIEYGLRNGDSSVLATGRVLFTPANRCLTACGTVDDPTVENWPDTPWDLHCEVAPCTTQLSPVFFSTARLAKVTTQVRNGTTFSDVDSWTLTHEFKDYGDEEQVTLWLKSIRHTGHVGGTASLPPVEFGGEALPNRVDAAAGVPVMWRWRMSSIKTETGAVITIDYAATQCSPSNLPADAHTNSMRCFPVRWTPEFFTEPIEDWFHKHVVSSVVETDTTGAMAAVETYYEYSTTGGGSSVLWAFDDSEFTEDEHRTYNQWRGYAQLTTRRGDPAQPQTVSRSRFYRGLDGEPLPGGGSRNVDMVDEDGNTVADHEALAGRVWESLSYNGASVIAGSTYQYWTRNTATQARDHDGGDLKAWLSGVTVEKTRTRLTSTVWQRAETRTSFDTQGRVIAVDNLGDVGRSGDESCNRTEYADNATAWIKNAVKRLETVEVGCGATPSRPADVASETLNFYDGSNTHGTAPTRGLPTRIDVLDDWNAGPVYVTTARVAYDALGRVVETTDALHHTSTTAYTPTGAGPLTQTVATNPLGHTTTTTLTPARGVPTATVDPNSRRTELIYDPLGRTTAVWLPGRSKATQTANLRFEYLVRDSAPSAVVTRTLNHVEEYVVDVVLYDALLRQRQTQTETGDRRRLVTETIYDTQGRVEEEFGPNYNTSPPDPGAIVRAREDESAARTQYLYDAASRVTNEVFYNRHVERWRTTTSYGGDPTGFMVTVQPPPGAPASASITDALGRTIEKHTYRSNTPAGTFDALTYLYSPTGQLEAMTDQAGNEWSWEYDLRGQQISADDPDAGSTTLAYDAAGQLASTTDARGETIVNGYDELGRQTTRHDGDGTLLAEWQYDTAIGGKGMLAKAIRWVNDEAYINETVRVNSQGLVTQSAVTLPASLGPLAGRHFFTQSYAWNGLVAGQGLPAVGGLEGAGLTWAYDHVGNPTALGYDGDDTFHKEIVNAATFTPFNEIQTRRLGGPDRYALHGFVYEEGTRRLERATFDREASINHVADLRYRYDPAGNLRSIADVPADLPGNHELQCFQYDPQRRLVEAWAQGDTTGCAATPSAGVLGGPAPYWNSYSHDSTGNRTGETLRVPGQPTATRTYTFPAAGQPRPHALQQVTGTDGTIRYGYDPAGNTTSRNVHGRAQTLSWDAEGNLEQVDEASGDGLRMIYDADGNRLIRDDGESVTAYLPNTEVTWNRATDTVEGTRYFTHAGQVVAICTGQDVSDWTWMGVDHHGSTTTHAINAFTAVEQVRRMDPYGNPRGTAPSAWPGQQSFVGGVEDPTGLIHIGARSYDPVTGRFISVDPVLVLGDDQQINGYAYANNNPITYSDPTGLVFCSPDGQNICPGQNVSSQLDAANATGEMGRPPAVVTSGTEENGLNWTVTDDGQVDFNGWLLPEGAPEEIQALAAWVDYAIWAAHDPALPDLTVYEALIAYCEEVGGCTNAFYREIHDRNWELVQENLVAGGLADAGGLALMGMGAAPLRSTFKPNTTGLGRPAARNMYCRPNSFEAGTLVLMADGTSRPIEDIQPGEVVMATDTDTGVTEPKPVTDVITGNGAKTMVDVSILGDGWLAAIITNHTPLSTTRDGGMPAVITATDEHPFWVVHQAAWIAAEDLQPGDVLLTAQDTDVTVAATTTYTDTVTVYNLTVADIHTYYVLARETPVLVHNTGPGGCGPNTSTRPGQIADYFGYSTEEIKDAIHAIKRDGMPRGGAQRNPDVVVDLDTGEVYVKLPDGNPSSDSIGNIFDHLRELD